MSQRVTSPRRTRARSYSAQFPTRYVVLYFGCTLDFTSRSCPAGGRDGQHAGHCSPTALNQRTNAATRGHRPVRSPRRAVRRGPAGGRESRPRLPVIRGGSRTRPIIHLAALPLSRPGPVAAMHTHRTIRRDRRGGRGGTRLPRRANVCLQTGEESVRPGLGERDDVVLLAFGDQCLLETAKAVDGFACPDGTAGGALPRQGPQPARPASACDRREGRRGIQSTGAGRAGRPWFWSPARVTAVVESGAEARWPGPPVTSARHPGPRGCASRDRAGAQPDGGGRPTRRRDRRHRSRCQASSP